MNTDNMAREKLGVVAVSRDCFPIELSARRKACLLEACSERAIELVDIETIVESENDIEPALRQIEEAGVNALVLYLGNFGPEGPTTLLASRFAGPTMVVAAAEESGDNLVDGRGDAYCGMLNCSYNLGLRKLPVHIPEYPVGLAGELADLIARFRPIARAVLSLRQLKIFAFGPRPQDFLACNAPIKPLYDLGVEVMENSELDLYDVYREAAGDPEVKAVAADMAQELGAGNRYPDLLDKLAQYEVGLRKFMAENLGGSRFAVFANKCWPAFEKYFEFVPCYVNSRLAGRGIPVACEVDIYGALSEYIVSCVSRRPATLLDINNTVPEDIYENAGGAGSGYASTDLFMGFHCGNTCSECVVCPSLKHQLIMHRLMEPGASPNITRGTLEGRLKPGAATLFRLQSTADTILKSYMAEGEILDVDPRSFGGIGVFAVPEMGRFYRHVLIEQRFPHHGAVAFAHVGAVLFDLLRLLGVENRYCNQPAGRLYGSENPFSL